MTEFDVFLPVFSVAGSYDNRPHFNGLGEVTSYISFSLAEKAGVDYLNGLDPEQALSTSLSIMVLKPKDIEESLFVAENWDGIE